MNAITLKRQATFDFAVTLLQRPNPYYKLSVDSASLSLQVDKPIIARLIDRLNDDVPVILPYCTAKTDAWLIAGNNRSDLDRMMYQSSRFVIPSYAHFASGGRLPELQLFEREGDTLQRLGATLFPDGYYKWLSPVKYRGTMFERLAIWLDIHEREPRVETSSHPSYRELHQTFETALAAANWDDAQRILNDMKRLNRTTADNFGFLHIQLLAHQHQWQAIWNLPDYANLATMRMPRKVRKALLTAFHHTALLSLEQVADWNQILQQVADAKSRLGGLLTGRFDLTSAPIIRVFAYQAVLSGEIQELKALKAIATDQETRGIIDSISPLVASPSPFVEAPAISPLNQARQALANANFDAAMEAVGRLTNPEERTLVWMEIAFHGGDTDAIKQANQAYQKLSPDVQEHLLNEHLQVEFYLDFLSRSVSGQPYSDTVRVDTLKSLTWQGWFEQAANNPNEPTLSETLEELHQLSDERILDSENIKELSNALFHIVSEPQHLKHSTIQPAVVNFMNLVINDSEFPRQGIYYVDLYDWMHEGVVQLTLNANHCAIALRFTQAILQLDPGKVEAIFTRMSAWLANPVPTLEFYILELLELFSEYGLDKWKPANWYREWLTVLLALPKKRERTFMETWQDLAGWIQPGDDLIFKLNSQLQDVIEEGGTHPIVDLPPDTEIGIFTLRKKSAARAKERLLKRNPKLTIRICTEKDVNPQVKAIAQNSDLVVIVTSAITHSLTYGISGLPKNDPIYPQSAGTTSIVRAIEDYLGNHPLKN